MKSFKNFLNEKTRLLGKLKKHEKLLYNSYVDFLKDYYSINVDIEVSLRKPNRKLMWGWIDLIALSNGKYKIVVENVPYGILGKIGHEFTHIKQYITAELRFTEDQKHFIWKGKEHMLIKEYSSIKNFEEYKKVPWEAEAYKMQEKLPELFKKSKYFKELKGKDINLDFMIDNDAIG